MNNLTYHCRGSTALGMPYHAHLDNTPVLCKIAYCQTEPLIKQKPDVDELQWCSMTWTQDHACRCCREGTQRTFRASATLRTASVAAPPLAAKPDTRCFRPGMRPPTVPSGALAAGARLSPASHDAYEPVQAASPCHSS